MNPRLPRQGRLAGIDYGKVRIGIAVSDPSQILASPLETMQRQSPEQDARRFMQLVEQEQIVGWVVGLPVHTSGAESEVSRSARDFAGWLSETTALPVALFDERFTSQEADRLMAMGSLTRRKKKQRRDQLAAQILLAAFLESSRESPESGPGALDD